ncbi:transcriptional activator DEMETER [Quillaja saponaria]|uniref:Transcriptional activator DEMETER n=1 Tax=Quillaja saponaria TaxID=32244 RepID=A0AAD7M5U2_QUISA|nr:transcriptional activator DEMETER [Quillaja saponaria]
MQQHIHAEGRSSKRDHNHTIENRHVTATNPLDSSLLCQEIFKANGSHTNGFSETCKKRKTDNGPYANSYRQSSGQTIDQDSSPLFRIQGTSDVNPNALTLQLNNLSCYFESIPGPEKQSIEEGKYTSDQSASSGHVNLLKQEIPEELGSHAERLGKTNGFTDMSSFASLTANDIPTMRSTKGSYFKEETGTPT